MASPVRPTISMDSQRLPPTLNADLLRVLFLRVASPSDLVRASAACIDFCRLIADPSFLRRYRSLHLPLLFGSISTRGLDPVTAPHPNTAVARDFAPTVDFSFRHLPCYASIFDIRDGCILFGLIDFEKKRSLRDLAVCNPLSRAYHLVPPIPDDLLASFHFQEHNIIDFETFLAPSCDVEETSFRVIGCVLGKTRMVVFIFSSGSDRWSVGTSTSWDALSLDEPQNPDVLHSLHHAYGCFYWKVNQRDKSIKLDMNTMKLSTHDIPPYRDKDVKENIVIVEAGDGKLAMFSQNKGARLNCYTFSQDGRKKGGEGHIRERSSGQKTVQNGRKLSRF
ncbi:hypothetical protein EJB05_11936, partial [Eragrostis curvula]